MTNIRGSSKHICSGAFRHFDTLCPNQQIGSNVVLSVAIRIFMVCILTMVFTFPLAAATPTISNVSGSLQTGSTITISGQYLVDEDKTNWGTAYKTGTKYGFEGSNYTTDGYMAAPDANPQERGYDSTVKLMGSKSFKGRIYGTSSGCPGGNHSSGLGIDDAPNNTDIYVRMYSRWHSSGTGSKWPASHIKMLDVQGTGDQLYFQPVAGGSLPSQMSMMYNSAPHNYTINNFLTDNRWYCMEARFKSSSPTNFTAWVDGVQLANTNGVSTGSYSYVLFNMINACEFTNLDLTNWTDNFAVSTSRIYCSSIIEVGNKADYVTATKVYQEPIFLSDGSVQIKLDLTGLGSGPYYLWVTNNRQSRSAVYALDGSAPAPTPDGTAPTVSVSSPSAAQSVSGSLTISANASDNVGVVGVQFRLDGVNLGSEDTTSPYSITWDSTSVSNGSHTVTAVARDLTGNQTTATLVAFTVNNSVAAAGYTTFFAEGFNDNSFASRSWFDDTSVSLDTSVKYAGASSLKLTWSSGGTGAALIGAMRKSFTGTDSLYVSMYWRFNTDWVGSGTTYHPHLVMIPSDLDDPWGGIAYNYLNTYIETSNRTPRLLIQDGMNVNTSNGTVPNNLTATTENRDVAGCNGCLTGSTCGTSTCYSAGSGMYWNGRSWDGTQNLSLNTWQKVETYLKMNSISNGHAVPDGIMRMWVDGTMVINNTNVVYRTAQHPTMKWANLVIAPWIGDGSPRAQTMWIDELAVGSGLPTALQNPPEPPGGFRVVTP
jgi:hypothetical protein